MSKSLEMTSMLPVRPLLSLISNKNVRKMMKSSQLVHYRWGHEYRRDENDNAPSYTFVTSVMKILKLFQQNWSRRHGIMHGISMEIKERRWSRDGDRLAKKEIACIFISFEGKIVASQRKQEKSWDKTLKNEVFFITVHDDECLTMLTMLLTKKSPFQSERNPFSNSAPSSVLCFIIWVNVYDSVDAV